MNRALIYISRLPSIQDEVLRIKHWFICKLLFIQNHKVDICAMIAGANTFYVNLVTHRLVRKLKLRMHLLMVIKQLLTFP